MNKTVFIVAGASMFGLAAYLTIFMNTTHVTDSRAGQLKNMMIGYEFGNGEVIASYTFDGTQATQADVGPNALGISKTAICSKEGADGTRGLGPGTAKEPLNFEIPAIKELNMGGIDLSLDYRKSEDNCMLFSRGGQFSLSVKDGILAVRFKAKTKDRKTIIVSESTRYEIPADDEYRTYRFLFDPIEGRSEVFVNGEAIWSYDTGAESELTWKDSDKLIVGKDLRGDGTAKAFIDNVTIKATRQPSTLPVTLLNFEARAENKGVMVTWYTASESEIDSFIIERSPDAITFFEVGRLKATGGPDKLTAYALFDTAPSHGLAYYRLAPSNKPLKSMTISLIGYKYNGEGGDLKINDVPSSPEGSK